MPSPGSRNDMIDGWRGLSVLAVVVAHYVAYGHSDRFDTTPIHTLIHERASFFLFAENIFFRLISPIGEIGVSFFFVISGYLITKLLLVEEARNFQISVRAFYIRRAFRILPAFFTYLLALLLLRSYGLVALENDAFLRSGLFVCNFSEFKCSWWLAHTWSLSVEEQFYLVWPVVFLFFSEVRFALIFLIFIAVTAFSFFLPPLSGFAFITIGALAASSGRVQKLISRFTTPHVILVSSLAIFLHPLMQNLPAISVTLHLSEPIFIALVFFGTIEGKGPFVSLVSFRPVQVLGLLSYSVYLWQQLATAPLYWGDASTGAAALNRMPGLLILGLITPSIVSYFLIERPLISVGRKLSDRMIAFEARKPGTCQES
jgi:peptidoglycan/LPS O-acetylase OafA/YrhL